MSIGKLALQIYYFDEAMYRFQILSQFELKYESRKAQR